MKKGDLLFVYGTLRLGESHDMSKMSASFIGEDKINGEIYNLGWFPGVKTRPGHFDPGGPFVSGDVFSLDDDEIVGHLDRYEGYPSLYNRIETETGHGRHVWVYIYNHEVSADQLIVSGDWFNREPIVDPEMAVAASFSQAG